MISEGENLTQVSEFLLMGLSSDPREQQVLFIFFLSTYLVTVLGNLLIVLAIITDTRLHTPMYFFLANLAFVDICFTTTTVPKMLVNHVTGRKGIPYACCLTQTFFFILFASLDCYLLLVMAYDRYEAICHPLHYTTSVTPQLCSLLVGASWAASFGNSLVHVILLNRLSFCTHNQLRNFFCELSTLLNIACSDTFLNNVVVNSEGTLTVVFPFLGILVSYVLIFAAVLRIPSRTGKQKAFSTCGSHLSVVSLFYGTLIGVYFSPTSSYTAKDTVAAVMYTVVTPMMNPFIYSLRNKDMKGAFRALITRSELHCVNEYKGFSLARCFSKTYFTNLLRISTVTYRWSLPMTTTKSSALPILCHISDTTALQPPDQFPNFFCKISLMLHLSCSDTCLSNMALNSMTALTVILPFMSNLFSYIFTAMLSIPSQTGKQKDSSTCGAHFSMVTLKYTLIGVYFNPTSSHMAKTDTVAAMM
ncbi:olfactory receptor 1361-like [Suncus etruscus]|uniref:olfactory receptor 1361-like n=1 Tax=Suncus etruscus TaxID=109475 RepID=UPI0021107C9D|nr:olfactory receptor 1361-like [Suncus etruscus]